jgi:Zn-dependent protease with chaperone function
MVTIVALSLKSWLKIQQLRAGGGAVVARDLGGLRIEESNQLDLRSRQLLNVVQEVAVAACIPPPPVYYMPNEPAINAFAAGYTPKDAIISVTKGCLTELNREQLQGIVAHEFSHILNGDMRQNIRTIGVLHGILFIIETAESCWRTACEMWESQDPSGGSIHLSVLLALAGAFLWPVGMIGLFFATIAKAGISRQREYLADATAVELTRNPHGISSALKRIAGFEKGTRVRSPMAVEASHLFFANGLSFNRILSTHPPITERIVRLDPDWDGLAEFGNEQEVAFSGIFEGAMNFTGSSGHRATQLTADADPVVDNDVYNVFADRNADEKDYGKTISASLPSELVDIVNDPVAAGAIIIAIRSTEAALASGNDDYEQIAYAIHGTLRNLETPQRLWLFDAAVNSVKSNRVDPVLLDKLEQLVAQRAACLLEFAWNNMVETIVQVGRCANPPKPQFGSLQQAESSCSIVVSSLVHAGGNFGPAGEYAFQRGAVHLQLPNARFLDPEVCDIESLESAVETLSLAAPSARSRVCLTISACITADGQITEDEALIVRGIISKLGYPIPQLLPGHPVTPGA